MKKEHTIFMVSPINAILEGLYQTATTLADLAQQGDFGIGTFNDLDGELVRLDGVTYRLDVEGVAHQPGPEVQTPFAAVCRFDPYSIEPIDGLETPAAFMDFLDRSILSPNMMFAIRIDGRFSAVRTRSVPRTANHTPLVEATALQKVTQFRDVEGTLVGFYTPAFMPSVNVPGYHFHFITADRTRGGHLLECGLAAGRFAIQICSRLTLNLPVTPDYLTAEFTRDARRDIEKAER